MFEPEFERDRLLQQQPGVLVFAAPVETAQHQEKIDDISFGAGPAYLQIVDRPLRGIAVDAVTARHNWLYEPCPFHARKGMLQRFNFVKFSE